MANTWTREQQLAITTGRCNILVAAAAGSGKTAVLVERIIKKITDPENNVDVDRLVIVTFTKAAAAEMKQRIRDSINALLEDEPDNEMLLRQLTLVNNAQITTIDSFCLNIVRNYFTDLNIDPGFRTADEGEIRLIENDVMEELLEEFYASKETDFYDLIDGYGTGRDDSAIEKIILKLYRFARSYPWPEEWFDSCLEVYEVESLEMLENNQAIAFLKDSIIQRFNDYDRQYDTLEQVCMSPGGPSMYLAAIQSDHAAIKMVCHAKNLEEMVRLIRLISFDNLGRTKPKDLIEEKKDYVKNHRDAYKDYVKNTLKGKLFTKDLLGLFKDIKDNAPAIEMMVRLAREFSNRMTSEKRERNIIDFNDMEHMALDILVHRENKVSTYTAASDALSNFYEEILIDEYQDSNMLQEVILTAVSKGKVDAQYNNIYMVGDVKQSIYKFRLACPQLFIHKYNVYKPLSISGTVESNCVKIELQKNFRSRENVLFTTNDVFRRIMNPQFTDIHYDMKAQLNPGFEYPKTIKRNFAEHPETEIYLIDVSKQENQQTDNRYEDGSEETETADLTEREIEAAKIAEIIQKLVHPENIDPTAVYDKRAANEYRNIRYSDIVILTRTVSGWADTFVNVLMNHGIPAYCDVSSGYFNVREIKLILNYLMIIDNPLQDIPMAAIMLSYFGRFNTNELTIIRNLNREQKLYESLENIKNAENGTYTELSETIKEKVVKFIEKLDEYRDLSEIISVQELLWNVLYDTGYYNYVSTMPAGDRRQANLDMLLEKAASFENTSYKGLFNFLRYIERMQKYEVDMGEASVLGENEDLVRIMSIHKSKGLEFPVVILAGMHKKMNQMDASGEVVIDQDLGIGTNVVRLDKRTKAATLLKSAVSMKITQDNVSEEMRVLYVAMTRAREKLIMTGIVKDADKCLKTWQEQATDLTRNEIFSYSDAAALKNYYDMVMPVACMPEEYNTGTFNIITSVSDVSVKESEDEQPDTTQTDTTEELHEIPPYPYDQQADVKSKITVSELKKMQHDADFDETQQLEDTLRSSIKEEEIKDIIPAFIAGKQETLLGNERGTAYHRVMECLDYSLTDTLEQVRGCMNQMVADEKMSQSQLDSVNPEDILKFCQSPIGGKTKEAFLHGKFRREQPFIFTDTTRESIELREQLIQGVIDLYLITSDGIILVDYKTDKVPAGKAGEEELIKRYSVQLDYYAKALYQLTDIPIVDKVIYSFTLGKEIHV